MGALAALILIVAAPVTVGSRIVGDSAAVAVATSTASVKQKQVKLDPALLPVCSCESTGAPYNTPQEFDKNGDVLRGKINHHDVGECQINETFNGAQAAASGFDIYTAEGNIKEANYLYEHEGLKPWDWSKSCWGGK